LFREDLFYRINVIELRVPALRERAADIPEIAAAILERLAARTASSPPRIAPQAMQLLQGYAFPGNVRELENVLERAVTLCTDGVITPDHVRLRTGARPGSETSTVPAPAGPATVAADLALGSQLESIERDAIIKALEKTRYNKTAAAKLLGMTFRALRYRIKKLRIE
jgi:two-component system response regulator PilR (NtrC family)